MNYIAQTKDRKIHKKLIYFKVAPGQIEGSIPENSEVYGSRSSLRGRNCW